MVSDVRFFLAGTVLILGVVLGFSNQVLRSENKRLDALASQNMALFNACKDNFKINKEVSDAYFKENIDLRNRYDANRRLFQDSCLSLPIAAAGADAPAPEGYVWKGAVSVNDANDYSYECGEVESRLRNLQNWIDLNSQSD